MLWTLQPFSVEVLLTIFLQFFSLKSSEIIFRTASRSINFCKAELDAISAESAIQANHEGRFFMVQMATHWGWLSFETVSSTLGAAHPQCVTASVAMPIYRSCSHFHLSSRVVKCLQLHQGVGGTAVIWCPTPFLATYAALLKPWEK